MKTYMQTCLRQSSAQCTESKTGIVLSGATAGKTPEFVATDASGFARADNSPYRLSSPASLCKRDAYTGFPVSHDDGRRSATAATPLRSKALRPTVSANYMFGFVEIGGRLRSASSVKLMAHRPGR